jgi:hypothetical protein
MEHGCSEQQFRHNKPGEDRMNNCMKSIRAARHSGWFHLKIVAIAWATLALSGAVCSAAFTENFQDDIVGLPPTPFWTLAGTNGTTITENVASEGANKFLALRNTSGTGHNVAYRDDVPLAGGKETSGYLQFDIRFNQGIDTQLGLILYASKPGNCFSCYQPIELNFFHSAFNTNSPLIFRSRGNGSGFGVPDPNGFAAVTNNFPIGSWETIRVDFAASGSDPRGTYSVSWNGITNNYLYLNQNDLSVNSSPLAIDRLYFFTAGPNPTSESVDIDNIQFIPEPSAIAFLAAGGVLLLRRKR